MKNIILFTTVTGFLCWEAAAIRGGSITSVKDNPHLVSISDGKQFLCAGSLLTQNWVITVASCVMGVPHDKLRVRAGSWKTNALGQVAGVEKVVVHSMFNWYTQDYDIAVVKVKKPFVQGPKVKPIKISKGQLTSGEKLTVVGWGENLESQNGELRKLDVNMLSHSSCQNHFKYGIYSSRMLCSWVDSSNSPCWNDFGDPLKNQWGRLVGMYTWTQLCDEYPSVYTYIYPYTSWIAANIPELSLPKNNISHTTST